MSLQTSLDTNRNASLDTNRNASLDTNRNTSLDTRTCSYGSYVLRRRLRMIPIWSCGDLEVLLNSCAVLDLGS